MLRYLVIQFTILLNEIIRFINLLADALKHLVNSA